MQATCLLDVSCALHSVLSGRADRETGVFFILGMGGDISSVFLLLPPEPKRELHALTLIARSYALLYELWLKGLQVSLSTFVLPIWKSSVLKPSPFMKSLT